MPEVGIAGLTLLSDKSGGWRKNVKGNRVGEPVVHSAEAKGTTGAHCGSDLAVVSQPVSQQAIRHSMGGWRYGLADLSL